jgi:uncharacterized protein (DUF1919 family)
MNGKCEICGAPAIENGEYCKEHNAAINEIQTRYRERLERVHQIKLNKLAKLQQQMDATERIVSHLINRLYEQQATAITKYVNAQKSVLD